MDHQSTVSKPSLLGMIWSPGEQFDRIRDNPRIWGALIIVALLSAVAGVLIVFATPDDMYQVPQGPQLSEEQLASMKMFGYVGGFVGPLIGTPVGILISAAIMLLITTLARKDATFKQLLSLNAYIMFIGVIGSLLNGLIRLAIGGDPTVMVTSLASLAGAEGMTVPILNVIEVFTIWSTVLTAIGLHKVTGLSKGASWAIAIAFFLIGLVFALVGGMFAGMAGV